MTSTDWLHSPVGIDAAKWISRSGYRTVLAVAHTVVSCHRVLDGVDMIESDQRVQVVFTVAPDVFNSGLRHHLASLGACVVPWAQATRQHFDLALAASHGGLHELHAPLVVMPHGAGRGKLLRPGDITVYGLDAQRLTRDGRVLASALILAHEREQDVLRRQCPEALPVAVVAGDPCLDRLVASLPWRQEYRRALDVADNTRLVVISSTWGREGLFGRRPGLLARMAHQLPAPEFRVAALLHPAVWEAHGQRQIRAWLRESREAGLILLDPTHDWRGAVIAADVLVGDHGSVTTYAAAIGRPILQLGTPGRGASAHGSAQELVARLARPLDPHRALPPQLRTAGPVDAGAVTAALTSCPGRADTHLRRTMYRLLRLSEPASAPAPAPVPVPRVHADSRSTA